MIRLLNLIFASFLYLDVRAGIKWFRGATDKSNHSKRDEEDFSPPSKNHNALSKQSHVHEVLKLCDDNIYDDRDVSMDYRRLKIPRLGWTNTCAAGALSITVVTISSRSFSASDSYSWYSLVVLASTCVVQKLRAEANLYYIFGDFQILLFRLLPFRLISRLWGRMCDLYVTPKLRKSLYNLYIKTYNVKIEEALERDLTTYHTLGHFFRRKINPTLRTIHGSAHVVSPADGTVIHNGLLFNGTIQQVKGINYSIHKFLGPLLGTDGKDISVKNYVGRLMLHPQKNHLYSCVVYLGPGDYHRFHSPAEWTMKHRRHFVEVSQNQITTLKDETRCTARRGNEILYFRTVRFRNKGDLLSVNPFLLSWIPDLFVLNERVVMSGEWQHGFFSMTAVGATNVGSIILYDDETLQTNRADSVKKTFFDRPFNNKGVTFSKGGSVGEFRLGSTVVLVYEAPKSFAYLQSPGKHIKYGEPILCV